MIIDFPGVLLNQMFHPKIHICLIIIVISICVGLGFMYLLKMCDKYI